MGCCGSKGSSNAAVGKQSGTALSPMVGNRNVPTRRSTDVNANGKAGSPNKATNSNPAIGLLNQQEQNRIRSREKAVQALEETFKANEALVPSASWRRQYIKVVGVGPGVATAIADRLMGKTRANKKGAAGVDAFASSLGASSKHSILTLDLRALKIGDEGFTTLSKALAQDRIVENVILSGNEITDEGAKKFVTAVTAASLDMLKGKPGGGSGPSTVSGSACPSQMRLLVLADNPISSVGIAAVASCLDRLTALERLEIGRGQVSEESETEEEPLSEEAVHGLMRLIDSSSSLQTLVFKGTGNVYRTDFSPADLSAFLAQVVGQSRLASLFLQECFTTKPASSPPFTFARNQKKTGATSPMLPSIPSIPDPKAYLQPISSLSTALTVRTTQLSTLVLRFPLTDSAVAILCNGVAHAMQLANLSLRGCELSAAGLRLLGDALRSNRTITALDISYQSSMIAHPLVLQELRNSSKRRQSYMNGYAELRDSQVSSGTDSIPSKEEREHPLLPIIQVLHTNRTIVQLIMLGVNISVDDVEELCSCVEQSGNHVLTDVAYTSIGADALSMKLENFLSANREYGNNVGISAVSHRGMGAQRGSTGSLFGDTMTDRSQVSECSPGVSKMSSARNSGYYASPNLFKGSGPKSSAGLQHSPHNIPPPPANGAAGRSLSPLPPMRRGAAAESTEKSFSSEHLPFTKGRPRQAAGPPGSKNATSLDEIELRVGDNGDAEDGRGSHDAESDGGGTAPYFSQMRSEKPAIK